MRGDPKKQAVEIVKGCKPRSTSHKVVSQDDFLDGFVAQIEFSEEKQTSKIWTIKTSKYTNHAELESQLIQQMNAAAAKHGNKWDWLNQLFNVSGLIALVLVGTASYMLIVEKTVPEFLKAALLTIVGFYFGGLLNKSKTRKIAPPLIKTKPQLLIKTMPE